MFDRNKINIWANVITAIACVVALFWGWNIDIFK